MQCCIYTVNGRCTNEGTHDKMVDLDGTGRSGWLSTCDFHYDYYNKDKMTANSSRDRILEMHKRLGETEIKARKGLSAELQQEIHDKIASGEVDAGPPTEHPITDVDLRPKYDGEEAWIIHKASNNGGHADARVLPELRARRDFN